MIDNWSIFYFLQRCKENRRFIKTDESIIERKREREYIYHDLVTNQQSKYIRLHIKLFWGIGVFMIKNQDQVKIAIEDSIFHHLSANQKNDDKFIEKKSTL